MLRGPSSSLPVLALPPGGLRGLSKRLRALRASSKAGGPPKPLVGPPPVPQALSSAAFTRAPPCGLVNGLGAPNSCRLTGGPRLAGGPLPPATFDGALLVVETPQAASEACEALLTACKKSSSRSSNSSSNNSSSNNTSSSNSNSNSSSSNSSSSSSSSSEKLVMGYDTEHDPTPRGAFIRGPPVGPPLRVLQLGAPGVVAVFLLGPLGGLPHSVAALLQDPSIVKATQGAPLEALRLKAEFGVTARGFFCLHRASSLLQRSAAAAGGPCSVLGAPGGSGPRGLSLKALCAVYLKEHLSKQQQQSNWGGPLTEQQLLYAATDADASRRVYLAMTEALGPLRMEALVRCMGGPFNGADWGPEGAPPIATLSRAAADTQWLRRENEKQQKEDALL
ncbi:hypothetical protein Efla_003438 [Eimeria flavescens]